MDHPTADISIPEHGSSQRLDLSDAALQMLSSEVNDDATRLAVEFHQDGRATLHAQKYVGVVALPEGPSIRIRPKIDGANLVYLLRYARGADARVLEEEASIETGETFIEALGVLFETEIRRILREGLAKEFQQQSDREPYLRGQLDIQRQLQQQTGPPTAFACSYDELTVDTTANQAILFAASVLEEIVQDTELKRRLQQRQSQLRTRVTLRRVRPVEVASIELNRLTDHYSDILRLTELLLRSVYVHELLSGEGASFALLIDMDQIYEQAVERAVTDVSVRLPGVSSQTQRTVGSLVQGGRHAVNLRPDFVLTDSSGDLRCVGDAKWKEGTPPNSDFYQIAGYQQTHDVPGLLVYPVQDEPIRSETRLTGSGLPLHLVEFPVGRESDAYDGYTDKVVTELERALTSLLDKQAPET